MSDSETKADLATYTVNLRAVLHRSVEIAAASPEEAVRLVMDRRTKDTSPIHAASLRAESVDGEGGGYMVVGSCEDCSAVLLEGRDEGRTVDEDGVMLCTPCCKSAEQDGESEPLPADDADATQVIEPPGLLLDPLDGTGPEATAPGGGES